MNFPGKNIGVSCLCLLQFILTLRKNRRSPGGGFDNLLEYSCLENPHGQKSLTDYSPWDHASHLGLIRTCACVYVDGCPYMCERMCECVSTDIRVRAHICAVLHVHTHTRLYADVQVCTCLRVWM